MRVKTSTGWLKSWPFMVIALMLAMAPIVQGQLSEGSSPQAVDAVIGMNARAEGLQFPGSELIVRPRQDADSLVLRITKIYQHGTAGFRYDFDFYGLDPGQHNLSDFLIRRDGSELAEGELPAVPITVTSVLEPGGPGLLNDLELPEQPNMGGYGALRKFLWVLWIIGLLLLLFWRQILRLIRPPEAADEIVPEPTLVERLAPLVERARRGNLDNDGKAEFDRLILGYWRDRVGMEKGIGTAKSIRLLRDHPEAGDLVREVEAWLHRPPAKDDEPVDMEKLLEPYRDVAVPKTDPANGSETTGEGLR